MITILERKENAFANDIIQIACLHDDTKPTEDVATGSLALEVDTGDIYAFDEVGAQWNKING